MRPKRLTSHTQNPTDESITAFGNSLGRLLSHLATHLTVEFDKRKKALLKAKDRIWKKRWIAPKIFQV